MILIEKTFKRFSLAAITAFFMLTMSSLAMGQTVYDSFADGNFTANPAWGGTTGTWTVVANSDASTGATGSNTVRLSAAATTGTEYLSSQISSFGTSQEWGFWIGRRAQAFTAANQQYVWLYANEANLTSATVDGYRLAIGDDSGGDEIRLEYILNGAVNTTVITSTGAITNGLTDVGLLVRVTRSSSGAFQLFTSTLPIANGSGAIATDIPNSTNASVSQGTGTNNLVVPAANGYVGLAALHSTGATAIVAAEFDQVYFTSVTNTAPTITSGNAATFTVGTAGSFQVSANGSPAPTFSETGTLPSGVTFSAAGLLSGTPAAGTQGSYPITITATNGIAPDATQSFTLTVNPAAVIPSFAVSNASAAEGDTGTTNFTFTVTKTGTNGAASTVNFTTADGTAMVGNNDYTAASGTLTFADSDTSQTITISVNGDYNIESNETFTVNLTAGTNAAIGTAQGTGTIINDDVAGTVQFSSANYSAAENVAGGLLNITVTRTGGLGSGVTVTATTSDGTAVGGATCGAGIDFVNVAPVLMFSGGQTAQSFDVQICNDAVFENDDFFGIALSAPTGGAVIGTPATTTATIANDDAEPTFSINSVTQNEGNSGTSNFVFTVTKNGASENESSISYQTNDVTATTADNDYIGTAGTLTFQPADTTKTITVVVNGDTIVESNESFFVSLGGVSTRGVIDGSGIIVNDDAVTPTVSLTVTANSGSEAGTTVITVSATLSGGTVATDQTVTLGTSGTATLGADYTLAGGNLSGTTLTIPANATSGSTSFTVINDLVAESTETATLAISNPSSGITLGSPTTQSITITDNDVAPTITSGNSATFTVGAAGTFTVTATGNPTPATINVSGTLPSGVTFVNNGNGTATLSGTPAAATAGTYNLTFTASNGVSPDATQNFTLTVNAQSALSITDIALNEGNAGTTTFKFTVSLNAPAQAGGVTFDIATANDTATAGSDYTARTLTAQTIPAGGTSYSFDILVNGDTTVEETETFFVNVTNVTGATVADGQGLGTIINDDAVTPTVNLAIAPTSGSEAAATTFTATVTASSAVSGNQTVSFALTGGTATNADFTAIPVSITILDGQTTGTATFSVVNDAIVEGPETATLTISNPSSGITLGSTVSADVTVVDNDDQTAPTITYTPLSSTASTVNATLTVTITDNIGVPTTGGLVPRIYYRKNTGIYFSNACVLISGNGQNGDWNCVVDYSLVGNAASGDSITYFVVAQDTSGNIGSNPSGAAGTDVNNLTAIPNAPNLYTIGANSSIPGGTYSNLNTGSATLAGNVTVTNNLTLNGIVNNGAFTLTIDPFGDVNRISGYIIGNLRKVFGLPPLRSSDGNNAGGNPTFTYPVGTANAYSPVTASLTSFLNGSSLSVFAKQGTQPNLSPATTLRRYWTLAESGDITANLTFTYNDPLDISGTEATYQVIRVENGTAAFYAPSAIDPMNNTFTAFNVSNFSDWTVGSSLLAPTAAEAEISGRITNTRNRGLENVTVTLTGGLLVEPISVTTNSIGRYHFSEIPAGETYILTVTSKGHIFNQPSAVFTVNGNLTNINFVGTGW